MLSSPLPSAPRFPARFVRGSQIVKPWAAVVLAIVLAPCITHAQIIDWSNTTGAPSPWYHVGGNWSGGLAPTSTETAWFQQAATYQIWWDDTTVSQTPDVGILNILQGNVTFLNNGGAGQHPFKINGSGGAGSFSDFNISGASTSLTNRGLHLQSLGGGEILEGATLTLDGSHPQGAKLNVAGTTGFDVSGNLNVQDAAIFDNTVGYVGRLSGSTGTATVTGSGSQWNNSSDLNIGGSDTAAGGMATLNIADSGLVTVGGRTRIWAGSHVNLNGGRFEFGQTTLEEFATINAVSGSMAGGVSHTATTDVATLTPFQNPDVDLTEVRVSNSGTLYGDGVLGVALMNHSSGQVEPWLVNRCGLPVSAQPTQVKSATWAARSDLIRNLRTRAVA